MEDRISELLYYHYGNILQEEWLLWKTGLSQRYYNNNIIIEIYLWNGWTQHMTVPVIILNVKIPCHDKDIVKVYLNIL